MFEGLLDARLPIYAVTAANAVESSWATYCPDPMLPPPPTSASSSPAAFEGGGATNGGGGGGGSGLAHARPPAGWIGGASGGNDGGGGSSGLAHARPPAGWFGGGGGGNSDGSGGDGSGLSGGPLPPVPPPAQWTTCLGDLFSVAWLEDAETCDMTAETLEAQFATLRLRASNNFSYAQGSHAMRYGDLGIAAEVAGDYLGMRNNGSSAAQAAAAMEAAMGAESSEAGAAAAAVASNGGGGGGGGKRAARRYRLAAQRDADLAPLAHAAAAAPCPRRRAAAQAELSREVARRRARDGAARGAAALLRAAPRSGAALMAHMRLPAAAPAAAAAAAEGPHSDAAAAATGPERVAAARRRLQALLGGGARGADADAAVEALTARPAAGRGKGAPVVDDWRCLRGMVAAWERACGPLGDYGMRHARLLANLCNARVAPGELARALGDAGACGGDGRLLLA